MNSSIASLYLNQHVIAIINEKSIEGTLENISSDGLTINGLFISYANVADLFLVGQITEYHSILGYGEIDDGFKFLPSDLSDEFERDDYFYSEYIIDVRCHLAVEHFKNSATEEIVAKDITFISKTRAINEGVLSSDEIDYVYITTTDCCVGRLIEKHQNYISLLCDGNLKRIITADIKKIFPEPKQGQYIKITETSGMTYEGKMTKLSSCGDVVLYDMNKKVSVSRNLKNATTVRFVGIISSYSKIDSIYHFRDHYVPESSNPLKTSIGASIEYEPTVTSKRNHPILAKNVVRIRETNYEKRFGFVIFAVESNESYLWGGIGPVLVTPSNIHQTRHNNHEIRFQIAQNAFEYSKDKIYFVECEILPPKEGVKYRRAASFKVLEVLDWKPNTKYYIENDAVMIETLSQEEKNEEADASVTSSAQAEDNSNSTSVEATHSEEAEKPVNIVEYPSGGYSYDVIKAYSILKNESILIRNTKGEPVFGLHNGYSESGITISQDGEIVEIPYEEINKIYLFGVINSYSTIKGAGTINGRLPFHKSKITSSQLLHLVSLTVKHNTFLCAYSYKISTGSKKIEEVSYFSKKDFPSKVLDSIMWKRGTITQLYQKGSFFTVNHKARCQESLINDNIINGWLKENDFLKQECLYKSITHANISATELTYSVIDIRAYTQNGIVMINQNGVSIQCGSYSYSLAPNCSPSEFSIDTRANGFLHCIDNELYFSTKPQPVIISTNIIYGNILGKIKKYDQNTRSGSIESSQGNFTFSYKSYVSIHSEFVPKKGHDAYLLFDIDTTKNPATMAKNIYILKEIKADSGFSFGSIVVDKFGYLIIDTNGVSYPLLPESFEIVNALYAKEGLEFSRLLAVFELASDGQNARIKSSDDVVIIPKNSAQQTVSAEQDSSLNDDYLLTDGIEHDVSDKSLESMGNNSLFDFIIERFSFLDIISYYSKHKSKFTSDGDFRGTEEEGLELAHLFFKDGNNRKDVPFDAKMSFFLGAAKLADLFDHTALKNRSLYSYLSNTINKKEDQSVIECYAECFFQSELKERFLSRCICSATNKKFRSENVQKIVEIINSAPASLNLVQMLLNFPIQIFNELILDISESKIAELSSVIKKELNAPDSFEGHSIDYIKLVYKDLSSHKEAFRSIVAKNTSILDNAVSLSSYITEFLNKSISRLMFPLDIKRVEKLLDIIDNVVSAINTSKNTAKLQQIHSCFSLIKLLISEIESEPTTFSFKHIHGYIDFSSNTFFELNSYIESIYTESKPSLILSHHSFSLDESNQGAEIIAIENAKNCLPALNVKIERITPYENGSGFELNESISIKGNGQVIDSHENEGAVGEFVVPITITSNLVETLEMEIDISYEYVVGYDIITNMERRISKPEKQHFTIQAPISNGGIEFLIDNKFAQYADGKELKPEQGTDMFFGREEDINDIHQMIENQYDGSLKEGCIVAIYGQKRCGKSSVMHFLAHEIKDRHPNAVILKINAQGTTALEDNKNSYLTILMSKIRLAICSACRKDMELRNAVMKLENDTSFSIRKIKTMTPDSLVSFQEFLIEFNQEYGDKFRFVLFVDEFTEIYVKLKQGLVSESFLNFWRAFIQETGFVNIVVGQDFMPQFWQDKDITKLNGGGSTNGLGTASFKKLSYLSHKGARKLIEDPLRLPNGESRFKGALGKEALNQIIGLTGGSAFYLMKFCSALVTYMQQNNIPYVYKNIVDKVANGFAFEINDNPFVKKDFEPIYNAYSYDSNDNDGDEILSINDQALYESECNYKLLKKIADISDANGLCSIEKIEWDNANEKEQIIKSLLVREVLVNSKGENISDKSDFSKEKVKQRVQLFNIWLKTRG